MGVLKQITKNIKRKDGNNMTLHENAKFTCERLVKEYELAFHTTSIEIEINF